jgi:hypothetical protein
MPTSAIKRFFKQHKNPTQLVILNSCYSEEWAKVISEFGIYTIGMAEKIGDDASISFAGGLYIALGEGKSVEQAFDDAMIVIETKHSDFSSLPVIWKNGFRL